MRRPSFSSQIRSWIGRVICGCAWVAAGFNGLAAGSILQFLEPARTEYEVVSDARSGVLTTVVSPQWIEARRTGPGSGTVLIGSRVVVQAGPGMDIAAWMKGRPLKRIREFVPGLEIWEAADAGTAMEQAAGLAKLPGVMAAYPVMRRDWTLQTPYAARPRDTWFGRQWHLENRTVNYRRRGVDVNVRAAWPVTRGEGVLVAVVDNGVDVGHPDLLARLTGQPHFNFDTAVPGGLGAGEADHGTAVAGLIAAQSDNNLGVVGVAPGASMASWVIFAPDGSGGERIVSDDALADMFRYESARVGVQNHSWGNSSIRQLPMDALSDAAVDLAVRNGRNGRGTVLVRAGGNGAAEFINANDDGYGSDPRTILVAAVRGDGRAASYGSPGACILVGGPTGDPRPDGSEDPEAPNLATTDRRGVRGYNPAPGEAGDYLLGVDGFTGTSGSTPVVAGVTALILGARPELGYRDVQQVLALSARHWDWADPDVRTNAAGRVVSHNVGLGVPDAGLAVVLAKHWVRRPTLREVRVLAPVPVVIPDDSFRLLVEGAGVPVNLRNIRCLPSMGMYPEGGTAPASLTYVGRGNTNLPATVSGGMVLVASGVNTDAGKVQRAAQAGARAAVIFGSAAGQPLEILGGTRFSPLPAISMRWEDGDALARWLPGKANVTARIVVNPAVLRFTVNEDIQCEQVGVRLRTTHPRRGDLHITLVSPGGTRSVMQTVNSDTVAGPWDWTYWTTQSWMEAGRGEWRLEVTDVRESQAGSVTRAELMVRGVAVVDQDRDGLDDGWERRWFGGLGRRGNDDVNGDGLDLVREQMLGISPVAIPGVLGSTVQWVDGVAVRVTVPTQEGVRYRLEHSNELDGIRTLFGEESGRVPELEMMLPLEGRAQRWFFVTPLGGQ